VIIPCVCTGYKHIRSQAGVSVVSLIRCDSQENGISGISVLLHLKDEIPGPESTLKRSFNEMQVGG
jgi:hypothetical protein